MCQPYLSFYIAYLGQGDFLSFGMFVVSGLSSILLGDSSVWEGLSVVLDPRGLIHPHYL